MIEPWKVIVLLSLLLPISGASQKPFYNTSAGNWDESEQDTTLELIYEVFLIGESRKAFEDEPFMKMMESRLNNAGKRSSVVFLGDNIQSSGLTDTTHRKWEAAQKGLQAQNTLLEQFKGEVFFIPGYHDWARGGRHGLENVKSQRRTIEKSLDRKKVFLPKKGRPGPEEIHLSNDIVLIIFDS